MKTGCIQTSVILSEAKDLLVGVRFAPASGLIVACIALLAGCAGPSPASPTPTPAAAPATAPAAPSPASTPTARPSPTPSSTATPAPTATRTPTPTPMPSRTATAAPTVPPSPAPTLQPTQAPPPPYAAITTAGGSRLFISLEIADTPQKQMTGLMNRQSIPEDAGMVFAFPGDVRVPFWMKDTLIPLSIAFISQDGRILEIQDMEPLSEELHPPAQAYRYALEVNQGYFKRHGVAVADRIEFVVGGSR